MLQGPHPKAGPPTEGRTKWRHLQRSPPRRSPPPRPPHLRRKLLPRSRQRSKNPYSAFQPGV